MIAGLDNQWHIVAAIDPSHMDKGIMLSCTSKKPTFITEDAIRWEKDILTIKQLLFSDHRSSFYGVMFDTATFEMQSNNNVTRVEGIIVPLTSLHLLKDLSESSLFLFDESFHFLLNETNQLLNQVDKRQLYPSIYGQWETPTFIEMTVVTTPKISADMMAEKSTYSILEPKLIDSFLFLYLQHYVFISETYQTEIKPYFSILAAKTSESQVKEWMNALEKPWKTLKLSRHLYPLCINHWQGENPIEFQLQIVMYEPESLLTDWEFEWFMKEWTTGKTISVTNVMRGQHPFRKNPLAWLEEEISHFKTYEWLLPKQGATSFFLSNETISSFLLNDVKELESLGVAMLVPEKFRQKITPNLTATVSVPHMEEENFSTTPWIRTTVNWQLQLNGDIMNQQTFIDLVEQKQQMIRLHDEWVMWDLETANELLHQMMDSSDNKHIPIFEALKNHAQSFSIPDHSNSKDEQIRSSKDSIEWSFDKKTADMLLHKNVVPYPLRHKWEPILKSYQKKGVQWLLHMRKLQLGCCLADDMGLGKTVQTITYIDEVLRNEKSETPFLILCPSSLVHNWKHELRRFAPQLKVYHHEGSPSSRKESFLQNMKTTQVIICSYPIAKQDHLYLRDLRWTGCIFDEAQMLKNSRTKLRQAIKEFDALHSIALTGTPVENHPMEVWSLMDLLIPGLLKDETWFFETFLQEKNEQKRAENITKLRDVIQPFLLRRSKESQFHELAIPEKTMIDHSVSLTDEQVILYEATVEELMTAYDNQSIQVQRALLFKTMTKLKQICNHPDQLFQEENHFIFEEGRSEKWDLASEMVDRWIHEKKRGLIFTQYRFVGKMFQRLGKFQHQMEIPFFHGGLSSKARQKMIAQFQTDSTIPFMVISLRAGGFGMNLTEAAEVLHYDRWWNPAVEAQATDRVHRIGQSKPVTVHTITNQGTIEERIGQLIKEKEKLQKALVHGKSFPLWELSREELRTLFSL
ncbi:SNF2-related protein [Salipaludibacillus sp. CF4.18]|uniref:DEAD/DEAH box helicase n=1 Tax=Salipaludibacillus sp. CF4.18 TaxID=3373081 RepID=UPI003EE73667